jgi:hypothetical protein
MEMPRFAGIATEPRRFDQEASVELPPNATSLDLLRAIYRCPTANLQMRIRCAVAALPHEHPRLMVTAQVNEQSFAEILDRRLAKLREMENGKPPVVIENLKPQPVDVRPPMPRIADRRYRRF